MKKKLLSLIMSAAIFSASVTSVFAVDINETYDDVKYYNDCETASDTLTQNSGAPDGTKYYTNLTDGEYRSLGGLSASSSEDYMWEIDVLFDEVGRGFTIRDNANKKYMSCVTRQDKDEKPYIAVQTGTSKYSYYTEIDTASWYHIQLIGQYGTEKPLDMVVYKWTDGAMEQVGEYTNISKRNNIAAGYIQIEKYTSFDNVKITKLGADTLTISTIPENVTEINAGATVNMSFAATRNGKDVTAPSIEWKVYENDEEITDESVTVSPSGIVTASENCTDKDITVKVVSTEKGTAIGEYALKINSVDLTNEKYDKLSLSAEKKYVRAGEPLALTLSATKNGEDVQLDDGDVAWSFYDENNIQNIGNKYISVEGDKLYVTDKVISQNITLRAENSSKTVSASLPVRIKGADVTESDEEGKLDKLLVSNAFETILDMGTQKSSSWDGSHYYEYSTVTDLDSVDSTTEDTIIEYDVKFLEENSGTKLRNGGNTKEGGQLARQGDKIGRIGSGNKFLAFSDGDADSWYHIQIVARCGSDGAYGKAYIYKYNENGEYVHPDSGEAGKAVEGTLDLRTMYEQSFHHLQVQAGTAIDNLRIIKLVPDEIVMTLSADTVFAGGNVQGSVKVLHKGTEIPSFPNSNIKWEVYDSENKYLADDKLLELITIDADGIVSVDVTVSEQTVYIRATSTDSGMYASCPLTIKGSDIFNVTGFGLNEDGTKIEELKVNKNFFYNGDVVFIVAVYGDDGQLLKVGVRSYRDNTLALGENKIGINVELPEEFAQVKAMVWTSLG